MNGTDGKVRCRAVALDFGGTISTDHEDHMIGQPLTLVSAHLAPASPAIRLAEAEAFRLITKNSPGPVIAAGVLDRGPALALEAAGLTDTGACAGDTTPTACTPLPYRCDRIYTTLPADALTAYQVITGADGESGHRPVAATFGLTAPASSPTARGRDEGARG